MPELQSFEFSMSSLPGELKYVALIFALFVFPRFLIGLGIPYAITSFAMGFLFTLSGVEVYSDNVISLLSTLGIVSLFLFAGLEVDTRQLRKDRKVLGQHIFLKAVMIVISSFAFNYLLGLDFRASCLFALALLTPSTGFILDSIDLSNLNPDNKYWIRSKAIAAEIVALMLMFGVIKSASGVELLGSVLAMGLLIIVLPVLFVFFLKKVVPLAPQSEFGFLLITALLAGIVTKSLGAYYLIGAFVVGIVARRFEMIQPEFSSKSMMKSLKFFTNFFTPFYFFHAGAGINPGDFSIYGVMIGVLLLIVFIPIRLFMTLYHRKYSLNEGHELRFPVAASLLPNLVFGLVLMNILRERFDVPTELLSALVIYTLGSTLLPPVLMHFFWKGEEKSYGFAEVEKSMGVIDFYEKRDPSKDRHL